MSNQARSLKRTNLLKQVVLAVLESSKEFNYEFLEIINNEHPDGAKFNKDDGTRTFSFAVSCDIANVSTSSDICSKIETELKSKSVFFLNVNFVNQGVFNTYFTVDVTRNLDPVYLAQMVQ